MTQSTELLTDETAMTMVLILKSNAQAKRIFKRHIQDNDEILFAILCDNRIEIATTLGEFLDIEAYIENLINDEVCYDIEYQYQDQTENKNQNQTKS